MVVELNKHIVINICIKMVQNLVEIGPVDALQNIKSMC